MKPEDEVRNPQDIQSHPAGVRGLKRGYGGGWGPRGRVAPRRGAWIETSRNISSPLYLKVAPRRGAWIETIISISRNPQPLGRTPQGCVD